MTSSKGLKSLCVSPETHKRIMAVKIHPRDTIEMIISRLLDEHEERENKKEL